jgi:hypothetical protein
VTDYKWACTYAKEFAVSVEDLDLGKLRTIRQEAVGLLRRHNIFVMSKVRPRLYVLYPGIRLTTDGKSMERTSVRVVEKCQLGMNQFIDMATF